MNQNSIENSKDSDLATVFTFVTFVTFVTVVKSAAVRVLLTGTPK